MNYLGLFVFLNDGSFGLVDGRRFCLWWTLWHVVPIVKGLPVGNGRWCNSSAIASVKRSELYS